MSPPDTLPTRLLDLSADLRLIEPLQHEIATLAELRRSLPEESDERELVLYEEEALCRWVRWLLAAQELGWEDPTTRKRQRDAEALAYEYELLRIAHRQRAARRKGNEERNANADKRRQQHRDNFARILRACRGPGCSRHVVRREAKERYIATYGGSESTFYRRMKKPDRK